MRSQKTQAVILTSTDVFDADRSYLLFTKTLGKIRARGKGVRKPTSRLTGHLLPHLPCTIELSESNGWYVITSAQSEGAGAYPADSLEYLQLAEVLAEGVDKLFVEHEPHPHVYDALVYTIELLKDGNLNQLIVLEFLLKCAVSLGYKPELAICVRTGEPLDPERLVWDSQLGGVQNAEAGKSRTGLTLSKESVVALRQLAQPTFVAHRVRMQPEVEQQVRAVIIEYIQTIVGKPLRSVAFL